MDHHDEDGWSEAGDLMEIMSRLWMLEAKTADQLRRLDEIPGEPAWELTSELRQEMTEINTAELEAARLLALLAPTLAP